MKKITENLKKISSIDLEPEIVDIVNKNFWGKGYALEGANACMQFAFEVLHAEKVIAQIRPGNLRSRKVAEKLGMKIEGEFAKQYRGVNMPHLIYSMERSVWLREGW